jgi:hypothetical protein
MPRTRYVKVAVGSGAGEILVDALAGLGTRNRKIIALWPSHAAIASVSSAVSMRVYLDQEQVVDFDLDAMKLNHNTANAWTSVLRRIPVDLEITAGQGLKVGFHHATVTPAGSITLEYQET